MPSYVYVNNVHDKAKVHAASCSYCNHGHGMHGVSDAERQVDTWEGPFDSLEEALAFAKTTGKTVSTCGSCGGA